MRFLALIPLTLFLIGCNTLTEKPEQVSGSPQMVDVAEGAVIEIAETLQTSGKAVIFKRGRIQGWWNYDAWTYDCRLLFSGDPGNEVSEGRYRIVSAKYHINTAPSDGDFNAINNFKLSTLAGVTAEYMRCTKRGSFYDQGSQQTGPITVQEFKRTVGRYLNLVLKEDCDDPVNANICRSN